MIPNIIKLPIEFDTERLLADVRRFAPEEWIPHFNTGIYRGDWSGIALRAANGAHVQLYPDPTATDFIDTPLMARCEYIPDVLTAFDCEKTTVRFLKLAAGAEIGRHRDYELAVEDGEVRIHIPVCTNPDVEFILEEKRVDMKEGEAWYLNFNCFHSVRNLGSTDRIHLVMDCVVNEALLKLLRESG